jgi:integrase
MAPTKPSKENNNETKIENLHYEKEDISKSKNTGEKQDVYKYYLIVGQDGAKKWIPAGDTTARAEDTKQDYIRKQDRREIISGKTATIIDSWLEYSQALLKPSTYAGYKNAIKDFKRIFGTRFLSSITGLMIEQYMITRMNQFKKSTLKTELKAIRQMYSYAKRLKLIQDQDNVSLDVKIKYQQDDVVEVFSQNEISCLLSKLISSHYYGVLWYTLLLTGARDGELLALNWEDIDFQHNQIKVNKNLYKGVIYTPKTPKSNRLIDCSTSLMLELKKWKLRCPSQTLVFPSSTGKYVHLSNLTVRWHSTLDKLKVPIKRMHVLRHTNASLRLKGGQQLAYVSQQLGHSSPLITLRIYAHLIPADNAFVNQQVGCLDSQLQSVRNSVEMVQLGIENKG